MQVVQTIPELRAAVAKARAEGKSVGFVPTMGCLHAGHLALVARARREAAFTVVSIFVNPTQFGPNEDFSRYPRTFDADRAACASAGADLIFAPSPADFYPTGAATWVDVEGVSQGLCGEFRPGHFRGVATVVAMLFNAVQADVAVFGQKDLQQLAVIRRMVRDLHFPVRLIAHDTVREPNGVAMSSRNRYLTPEDLQRAAAIPAALAMARDLVAGGETDAARVRAAVAARLGAEPALKLQYAEIVDAETMAPVTRLTPGRGALAIACHLGSTRLIDNTLL
jgi:pantoate--beta-alanine ligase